MLSSFSILLLPVSCFRLLCVFVQISSWDWGHVVQVLQFCGRLTTANHLLLPLTLFVLDFALLLHLLLGLGDVTVTASTKPCAFFSPLLSNLFCPVTTCHANHLYPSACLSPLSLCFSLSLKSSTPESPKTPTSPWDLEWLPAHLTHPYAPSHTRTWTQDPKQKNLCHGVHGSKRILTVKQLITLNPCTQTNNWWIQMQDGCHCPSLSHFLWRSQQEYYSHAPRQVRHEDGRRY